MKITATTVNFGNSIPKIQQNKDRKNSFLDRIHENTKNNADMTDTIVVPRTIFKGYLGIMVGTTLVTLGGLFKNSKIKAGTMGAGLLASLYGTWAFVRPFIIKDAGGVTTQKQEA